MGDDELLNESISKLEPAPFFRTWQWVVGWLVVVAVIATLALVVVNVLETRSQSFKSSDAECARQVTADQNTKRDDMTVAKARMDSAYVLAQIHIVRDPSVINEEAAKLQNLATVLANRVRVVEQLPDLASEVERRCG